MRFFWLMLVSACSFVGESNFDDIEDVDGDGLLAERFGGDDCDDSDANIGRCDEDGDGYITKLVEHGTDCNDLDAAIHPDQPEVCDGVDNDCDGDIDLADDSLTDAVRYFADLDNDGFGDDQDPGTLSCEPIEGAVENDLDCDDLDDTFSPLSEERCDDADRNCDGDPTEGSVDGSDWYQDADGDGAGDPNGFVVSACEAPSGNVANNSRDCDDADSSAYNTILSGADEVCDGVDNDCNGLIDEQDPNIDLTTVNEGYLDADGDGWGAGEVPTIVCGPVATKGPGDCNDADPLISPETTWYRDADNDDLGDNSQTVIQCDQPDGFVRDNTDCDDENADSGAALLYWYEDADGDGYASNAADALSLAQCNSPGSGWSLVRGDCNDDDLNVKPYQLELCDGIDNDCDGEIDGDNAVGKVTFYADEDGDGYGYITKSSLFCPGAPPDGFVDNAGDCNDTRSDVNPSALEVCDNVDNNCDGNADTDTAELTLFYQDLDEDGFGDTNATQEAACIAPPGFTDSPGDCDDELASVQPGALEICDGVDNDCSGVIDDNAIGKIAFYLDNDGDSFGDIATAQSFCEQTAPTNYVQNPADCNDHDSTVHPDAVEICDGVDNNCDNTTDDVDTVFFVDVDNDGYGIVGTETIKHTCTAPANFSLVDTDCDDSNPLVHPDQVENCATSFDDNCDGDLIGDDTSIGASNWYIDNDEDNFGDIDQLDGVHCRVQSMSRVPGDCDDNDATSFPGAHEVCGDVDHDCNGVDGNVDPFAIDRVYYYKDFDQDSYGAGPPTITCPDLQGDLVDNNTDCNDSNTDQHLSLVLVSLGMADADIQGAVSAICENGALVFEEGTYTLENITLKEELSVFSQDFNNPATITSNGGPAFVFEGTPTIHFSNLTFAAPSASGISLLDGGTAPNISVTDSTLTGEFSAPFIGDIGFGALSIADIKVSLNSELQGMVPPAAKYSVTIDALDLSNAKGTLLGEFNAKDQPRISNVSCDGCSGTLLSSTVAGPFNQEVLKISNFNLVNSEATFTGLGSLQIEDSIIHTTTNQLFSGAFGVFGHSLSPLILRGTTIDGGNVRSARFGELFIEDGSLLTNLSDGLVVVDGSTVVITNSTLSNFGGPIEIFDASVAIEDSTLLGPGTGFLLNKAELSIKRSELWNLDDLESFSNTWLTIETTTDPVPPVSTVSIGQSTIGWDEGEERDGGVINTVINSRFIHFGDLTVKETYASAYIYGGNVQIGEGLLGSTQSDYNAFLGGTVRDVQSPMKNTLHDSASTDNCGTGLFSLCDEEHQINNNLGQLAYTGSPVGSADPIEWVYVMADESPWGPGGVPGFFSDLNGDGYTDGLEDFFLLWGFVGDQEPLCVDLRDGEDCDEDGVFDRLECKTAGDCNSWPTLPN